MAAGFNIIRSTDVGAPSLTGQVGSLIALLDYCLPDWVVPFSGTNLKVYQPPSGLQPYLRVDDNASLTGVARDAQVRGYAAMTGVSTGTNPFPTVAQRADANYWVRKSDTADGTTRAWWMFKTERFFRLIINHQAGASTGARNAMVFGEFSSYLSGDLYPVMIGANVAASATGTFSGGTGTAFTAAVTTDPHAQGGASQTIYFMGARTALGSLPGVRYHPCPQGGTGSARPYNTSVDGGPEMVPEIACCQDGTADYFPRGRIPGWWGVPYLTADFNSQLAGNTWQGTGPWAPYSWEALSVPDGNGASGGGWETSNSPDLVG